MSILQKQILFNIPEKSIIFISMIALFLLPQQEMKLQKNTGLYRN